MNIITLRLIFIVLAYIVAIFIGVFFGIAYNYLFPYASGGSFIGDPDTLDWLIGYPLAVIFLLTFFIHAHKGKHPWRWNIIALVPAILFEVLLDPVHIYVPIILGLIAWGLGHLANKVLWKLAP